MLRAILITAVTSLLGAALYVSVAWAGVPEVPVVSVGLPVHASEAVFEGVLNPKGTPSEGGTYQFVYRPSTKKLCKGSGELKAPEPAGLGLGVEDEVLQPEEVTGLAAGTEYAVCLVAENLSGNTASAAVSFTTAITPETPTGLEAKPLAAMTATLNGILNPGKAGDAGSYVFLYKHSSSECEGESQSTPTSATGAKEEPAKAEITGLAPHTEYTFCLQASNEAGETTTSASVTFTTRAGLPEIEEESVTEVADTSATLHASINPQGAPTSYRFEYAPFGGAFKSINAPEGIGSVGEGDTGVPVEAHMQTGLEPGVSYEFRVSVDNEISEEIGHPVEGEPTDFNTQQPPGAFTLPDGRAYELVSPPQKQGSLINNSQGSISEAAEDGSAITYQAAVPTEPRPEGFPNVVQILSKREASGWQTKDLTYPVVSAPGPAPEVASGREYRFFSSNLSHAVLQPLGPLTGCMTGEGAPQPCISPAASEPTAFLENLESDAFSPLVTGCPESPEPCAPEVREHANVPAGTIFGIRQEGEDTECIANAYCGPIFVAATPDFSHVVLESDTALAGGEKAVGGLYEWTAGKLAFIGMEPTPSNSEHGKDMAHGPHGISRDGSRVILNGTSEGHTGLLLHDTVSGETLTLNEGLPEGTFQGANAEDSRVFFSAGGELYVYETTSVPGAPLAGKATDLTEAQGVSGLVLGVSEDGSYVYFVSPGVLSGSRATAAGDNLYVDHYDGTTWNATFIAALSSSDSAEWETTLEKQLTRVSPSGKYLAFMSEASLTGYDNRDATTGRPVAEVYLYHVEGEHGSSMTCVSCDPTGARPNGVDYKQLEDVAATYEAWNGDALVAADLPGWQTTLLLKGIPEVYQPRYLSDSGRLFFNSADVLVPQDTDGTTDVYEYEPEGIPEGPDSCSRARAGGSEIFKQAREFDRAGREGREAAGCVALISSGDSSEQSGFLDASEDGGDVFFLTTAKLVAQDRDTAYDVYDAHECTRASPCPSPPVEAPPCETEASCKASPSPQPPIYGVGPSGTFIGPGNVSSEPPARPPKSSSKPPTRAQRLAQALRSCRKDKRRATRVSCEKHARQKYGPAKKATRARRGRGGKR
jgi:hypothetical protein